MRLERAEHEIFATYQGPFVQAPWMAKELERLRNAPQYLSEMRMAKFKQKGMKGKGYRRPGQPMNQSVDFTTDGSASIGDDP